MRLFLIIFCVIAIVSSARAATGVDDLLSRARPKPDFHLAYGDQPDQFGELWLPEKSGMHPVVIMIHGGCWLKSLPGVELMAAIADDLRKNGVAVWNIEYRRLGETGAGYPGTFLDIVNGTDYLRQIATHYQLDLSHVVIMGHSAGGHLAMWAAARSRIAPTSPLYIKDPLSIKTAVSMAGINDLTAYRDHGPGACGEPDTIDRLVNAPGHMGADAYRDTSPAALLPLSVDQLVVSGDADNIVPSMFGSAYGKAAQQAGDKVVIMDIPGAGHFDLIDPQSAAWVQIKSAVLSRLQ